MCCRKHLDKGGFLRAASLAEIGGFGYVGGNWVDWTGVLFECEFCGLYLISPQTFILFERGMTRIFCLEPDMNTACNSEQCSYG